MVSTWELDVDVGNIDSALLIALAATLILAVVIAAFLDPVARFQTIHGLVKPLGMALVDTRVTTEQALPTKKIAPSFRRNAREVIRRGDRERCLWVAWTA